MEMDRYFHIKVPFWGAWTKYGWGRNDWGIGLAKNRIDKLAKNNKTVIVRYGKWKQEYTISAKKVQKYPVERIKNYKMCVYIIPKSALNYRKKKSESEELKTLSKMGVFG